MAHLFFLLLCFFSLWLAFPGQALDNPQEKVTQLVKGYVLEKCPEWQTLTLQVDLQDAQKNLKELEKLPTNAQLKIGNTHKETKPIGTLMLPLEITTAGNTKTVYLRTKIAVLQKMAVAAKPIRQTQRLTTADVKLEERDLALLDGKFYQTCVPLISCEAKTNIAQGSIIFPWMIKEVPLVTRNSKIVIYVKGKDLMVRTTGTALKDGYLNDNIPVKRNNSKLSLTGKVVSLSVVEISNDE